MTPENGPSLENIQAVPKAITFDKITLVPKIALDTAILLPSMDHRIKGYSQRIRADVRVTRTLVGLGVLHPYAIYKICENGFNGTEDLAVLGINLAVYLTATRYITKPRRIKQLVPNYIRQLVKKG